MTQDRILTIILAPVITLTLGTTTSHADGHARDHANEAPAAVEAEHSATADAPAPHVLMVRGGLNTGGFLEGDASDDDEQLPSIRNHSEHRGNHGWGMFGDTLTAAGYTLTEIREGDEVGNQPIDFSEMDLSIYDAIVMASNNAVYPEDDIDALETYIRAGGGVLFISDTNFGENWPDAATSDQQFLNRFGWIMNQDHGTYILRRAEGDFLIEHPILENVQAFDGEGVSPIVIPEQDIPGVTSTLLVRAKNRTRVNDGDPGSTRDVTAQDAVLAVATVGEGRIVGHFDRNTFFNPNGAGTNLTRFDNRQYALNLIGWLVSGDEQGD